MSPAKRVVLISAMVLVLTVSSAAPWYLIRLGNVENMFPDLPAGEDTDPDIKSVREAFDNKTLNILLLGFDRNEERGEKYEVFRPDTIMVVSSTLKPAKRTWSAFPGTPLVPIYNFCRGGIGIKSTVPILTGGNMEAPPPTTVKRGSARA